MAWALYQAVGAVLAIPSAFQLLTWFVTNPRKTLHKKDRSQLQLPDPLPGLTHQWIETEPGIKLHAVRTSMGSSRPLMLLVHGFPEAWFSWKNQMQEFRDQYEVVAIDLRGYGESSKPQGRASYSVDRLAGDVIAVAEHLLQEAGHEKLVLVGHDWGGNVCWTAAHTAPHLLSALTVMCMPHPLCYFANTDWDQFRRSWYVYAFQMPWLAEAWLCANDYGALEGTFTRPPVGAPTGVFSQEDMERYKQAFGRPGVATAAINYYRAAIDGVTRHPYPKLARALGRKLTVPTLLLWAEEDAALGQQLLRGTDRHVESVRIELLKGCSHWAQQQQPAEVNRLMKEFLGGRSSSQQPVGIAAAAAAPGRDSSSSSLQR